MALLQISEPGQSAAPHQHRLAAGIDLGTTNSLIATVRSGVAETLPNPNGEHLLPSAVHYRDGEPCRIGKEAQEGAVGDPLNTILSVKRFMGRGPDESRYLGGRLPYQFIDADTAMPKIHTVAGDVTPVEVSAEILNELRRRGEQSLGGELTGVVITVPAYFDDAQRQATKDAARLAGLNVLRLLNEPTAAAVAYGLDQGSEGVIAVYDFGGGTFDISILRLNRGLFEVLATAGDSALGGDDIDRAVAEWMMQQAGVSDSADHGQLRSLLHEARRIKEALSQHATVELSVEQGDGGHWQGTLTRKEFNHIADSVIRATLIPCRRALRDAAIETEEIAAVVMVGGSTRSPRVRTLVGEFFESQPMVDIDPDRVVAIGAAMQADQLVGNRSDEQMLLLDVNPLSLGLETMGGLVEKVIPRNTTLPVAKAQEFTTFKDGQSAMSVHVLQGERELVDDCRSLARFELHGIPPMVAGAARIRVTFQVDADGLLAVTAREQTTGVESTIEVKPSYGLSDSEITRMLSESIEQAEGDLQSRQLREQQVEAQRVLEAMGQALAEDGERLLSAPERGAIEQVMESLAQLHSGDDSRMIKRAVEQLNDATKEFAGRRMNAAIQQALAGHKVDEFSD